MKNLLLFTLCFSIYACKNKEKSISIYEGCCGAEPTTYTVLVNTQDSTGGAIFDTLLPTHVYIPNIFMPNIGNFIDDYFVIFGGKGVVEIQSAVYTNDAGETLFSGALFQVNDPGKSWTGLKPDGTYYYGPFNYEVKIKYVDGQIKTVNGRACAFKCGDSDFPLGNLPNCFSPEQNNGEGQGDHSIPFDQSCF